MLIIPAIDLQQGRCVRLEQGQFDRVSIYQQDPKMLAKKYAQEGATYLHLVDLDGAKIGSMQQLELLKEIKREGLSLQAGGGIRDLLTARSCFEAGIERIVLGSITINDPETSLKIIQEVGPDHVVLALDVKIEQGIPYVAIHGWQTTTQHSLWDTVSFYQDAGIKNILCTDVSRDGMMSGPSIPLYQEAVSRFPTLSWQASGGVRHLDDIQELSNIGLAAVILGRVLYDPDFSLTAALKI